MSKPETMSIAFPFGGAVPASVIGAQEDRKVGPHEAIRVPRIYGEQLVGDRFAYEAEKKTAAAKSLDAVKD